MHRHIGMYQSLTPNGRVTHKRKPIHSHKIKIIVNKNMTNKEFMNTDFDKDGIPSRDDCRPFNKAMQHEHPVTGREEPSETRLFHAFKEKRIKEPVIRERYKKLKYEDIVPEKFR